MPLGHPLLGFFWQVHLSSVPNGIDNRVLGDFIQNGGLLKAVKEPPPPPEIREHLRPQPVPHQWHVVVGGIGEAEQDITKVLARDTPYTTRLFPWFMRTSDGSPSNSRPTRIFRISGLTPSPKIEFTFRASFERPINVAIKPSVSWLI